MACIFLPYDQDQTYLMPPLLQKWVGEGSQARLGIDPSRV